MFYRINWHPSTRRVLLESNANAAPAAIGGAYTNLGTFEHDNEDEESTGLNGMQGLADNHVLYHHVQDALYKQGIQDMQSIKILIDAPRSIAIDGDPVEVKVGEQSEALTTTATPGTAREKDVTFTSDNPTIATVDPQTGVVTGVKAGTTKIIATLRIDDTKTDDINVTVTA